MRTIKKMLKHDMLILLTVSIISAIILFLNFPDVPEYPEKEYLEVEQFLDKIIDYENKTISYGVEIPEDIKIDFQDTFFGFRILASKKVKYVSAECLVNFSDSYEPSVKRTMNNQEDLNKSWRFIKVIATSITFMLCIMIMSFIIAILSFIVRITGTDDEMEAIKQAYIRAGERFKSL